MKRPPRNDVIAALVILAIVLAEQRAYIGWEWGPELLKIPGVLAVAWRRVYPVGSCLVAVTLLGSGEWLESGDSDSIAGFAAMLLALFSLTAHARQDRVIAGAIAATLLLSLTGIKSSLNNPTENETDLEAIAGGILFVVVVVCGPAFGIGWGARRHAELRRSLEERAHELDVERERHGEAAAAQERSRMADDLHDVVADGVRAMLGELGPARRDALADPDRAEEAILRVEHRGREALVEMRPLLGVLRRGDEDLALAPQPSLSRLDELARRLTDRGLAVEVRVEGSPRRLTPGLDVAAYRVVEDALAGAGDARHIDVVVRWTARDVELEVAVDGPQLADAAALGAARERVSLFGGRFNTGLRPRGGSAMHAELPAEAAA